MTRSGIGPERRRLRRYGTAIPATVLTSSGADQGEIRSLSKRGLVLRTLARLSEGEEVQVTFQVPAACRMPREGDLRKIEVTGQVQPRAVKKGATDSAPDVGVRIEAWNQDFQELFERMLFLEPQGDSD